MKKTRILLVPRGAGTTWQQPKVTEHDQDFSIVRFNRASTVLKIVRENETTYFTKKTCDFDLTHLGFLKGGTHLEGGCPP